MKALRATLTGLALLALAACAGAYIAGDVGPHQSDTRAAEAPH
jgi:hypothetical protein